MGPMPTEGPARAACEHPRIYNNLHIWKISRFTNRSWRATPLGEIQPLAVRTGQAALGLDGEIVERYGFRVGADSYAVPAAAASRNGIALVRFFARARSSGVKPDASFWSSRVPKSRRS